MSSEGSNSSGQASGGGSGSKTTENVPFEMPTVESPLLRSGDGDLGVTKRYTINSEPRDSRPREVKGSREHHGDDQQD